MRLRRAKNRVLSCPVLFTLNQCARLCSTVTDSVRWLAAHAGCLLPQRLALPVPCRAARCAPRCAASRNPPAA